MAVKATKKPVKAVKKAVKAKSKVKKEKAPPKPKVTAKQIYEIVSETLQHNSSGEFDLPSILVRYLDKSDPRSKLGLHREYYVPVGKSAPFHLPDTPQAEMIFKNQASQILQAMLGEGVPVREKRFDPPFCKEHK